MIDPVGTLTFQFRKRGLDFVDADLADGQGVRIELRVHRVLLAAEDLHLRHARDLRNPLRDPRLGVLVERPTAAVVVDVTTMVEDRFGRPDSLW